MTIIQNALKCRHCGKVIESVHRHHFAVHYCKVKPRMGSVWNGQGADAKLVPSGEVTFNFAADGGLIYLRRVGDMEDFEDVSKYWPGFDGSHLNRAAMFQQHCQMMRSAPPDIVSIEHLTQRDSLTQPEYRIDG